MLPFIAICLQLGVDEEDMDLLWMRMCETGVSRIPSDNLKFIKSEIQRFYVDKEAAKELADGPW